MTSRWGWPGPHLPSKGIWAEGLPCFPFMVRKEMLKIPVACSLPLQKAFFFRKVFVSSSTPSLEHFSWSIPLTSHCQRPDFVFPWHFLFLLQVQLIPQQPSFCPPTLKFFCAPTNGFLNLHQPVSLGPFINVTWGNNILDILLFFPQNQIFPQKQSFQDTQKICHGFLCTSVPLPSLAIPTV